MYPPPPIDHRSMEHHYTESLGHDDLKFYPLLQSTINLWNPTTPNTTTLNLWVMMTLRFPHPPINHRSLEHHYTESLGHDDIKFYPPPLTNMHADAFPSDRKYYLFHYYYYNMWNKTQTEPYYIRTVLPIGECKNAEIPRADYPPQLNLALQSSTTLGQFDMWQNADVPRSGVPPTPGYQTYWYRALLHQVSLTCGSVQMY